MITTADIQQRFRRIPFRRFTLVLNDQRTVEIHDVNYIMVSPQGNRVSIFAQDGTNHLLSLDHVNSIVD